MKDRNILDIKAKAGFKHDIRKWNIIILSSFIVIIIILLTIFVENFGTLNNILNLLSQVAPIGIMACGVTFVMITGGIDVSGPTIMTVTAVIGADYMAKTGDLVFGPVLMLIVGLLMGFINGFAVAYLKMVPLVVTLAMLTIGTGIATAWTSGESVTGLSPRFMTIFNQNVIIIIFILIVIIFSFILMRTLYGRWLYLIGNNLNAAHVSGIPVNFAILIAYVISGLSAGFAGIINTAVLSSARPGMGPDTQILDIITAVVLGGTSVSGGSGTIFGTAVGAILIIMINNVINLLGIPVYFTGLIKGLIIIFAMAIDSIRSNYTGFKIKLH